MARSALLLATAASTILAAVGGLGPDSAVAAPSPLGHRAISARATEPQAKAPAARATEPQANAPAARALEPQTRATAARTAEPEASGQPIGTNRLVSVRADGTVPQRDSSQSAVSASGRYVAFLSKAVGLAPEAGPPRHHDHVYLRDRQSGTTVAIDVRPDGRFGNRRTERFDAPSVTADGRLVAFTSRSTDLAPGERAQFSDVFIRDTEAATTSLVTAGGNGDSYLASISADGSTVVFQSTATNLAGEEIPGRPTSIYRYDVEDGTTTLVSHRPDGGPSRASNRVPDVSADGTRIAYASDGPVVPGDARGNKIILFDVATGATTWVSTPLEPSRLKDRSFLPSISADGETVTYHSAIKRLVVGDRNHVTDVFAYDVRTGVNTLVSRSGTGRPANGASYSADVNADGTLVTFTSVATDLVAGVDTGVEQVYVRPVGPDADAVLISRTQGDAPGDGPSNDPQIAADGSLATFTSVATDLGPGRYDSSYVWAYRLS